jgi:iron complex transport system substrate-binding protein
MTVNGDHIISAVMRLCGGRNIFSKLGGLAPAVSREAVLAAAPEAIVYALSAEQDRAAAARFWSRSSQLAASHEGNLIAIPADVIHRPTPRILDGAAYVCQALERVRRGEGGQKTEDRR